MENNPSVIELQEPSFEIWKRGKEEATIKTAIGVIHVTTVGHGSSEDFYEVTLGTEVFETSRKEKEGGIDGVVNHILRSVKDSEVTDLASLSKAFGGIWPKGQV